MGCVPGHGHLPAGRHLRQCPADSVASRSGNPGTGRDVPAQRAKLVAIL